MIKLAYVALGFAISAITAQFIAEVMLDILEVSGPIVRSGALVAASLLGAALLTSA